MPELRLAGPIGLADLLTNAGLAPSKSEARRLVQQGGIKLDGAEGGRFQPESSRLTGTRVASRSAQIREAAGERLRGDLLLRICGRI